MNGEPWFIYVVPVMENGPVVAGYPGATVALDKPDETPPNGIVLLTVPKAPGATPVGTEDVDGVGSGGGGTHTCDEGEAVVCVHAGPSMEGASLQVGQGEG
jgi:hypothetical protein